MCTQTCDYRAEAGVVFYRESMDMKVRLKHPLT